MKRLYTMLLGALLPLAGWAAKDLPYASNLYQDTEWTTDNANNDAETWVDWKDTGTSSYVNSKNQHEGKRYKWVSANAADDWMISPALNLVAGKEYKVKVYMQSGNFEEALRVVIGTSANVADLKSDGIKIVSEKGKSIQKYLVGTYTPTTSGEYYIGLQACSDRDKYYLYMNDFSICENVFTPGAPTGLTVTPGANLALTAKLTWAAPTTDIDGAALPDGATYDKVTITRDGVQVAELAGTATEWEDDASKGLASGKHIYAVTYTISVPGTSGAKSAPATVQSPYIGPVAALSLPYRDFKQMADQDEIDTFWHFDKGTASNPNNHPKGSFYSGALNSITYDPSYSYKMDDWFISPAFKFEKAGVYRVQVKYMTYAAGRDCDLYLGTGILKEGFTDKIGEIRPTSTTSLTTDIIFKITEPCEKSIAMHWFSSSTSSSTFYLYNFEVEEWHLSPAAITDLTATITDGDKVTLAWTNPATDNTGATLTDPLTKIEIYRNDTLIKTLTDGLTPGAAATYLDVPGADGAFTYKLIPYIAETPSDGTPMSVNSGWVGDETQPLPYITSFRADSDITQSMWKAADADPDETPGWVIPMTGSSAFPTLTLPAGTSSYDDYLVSPLLNFDKAGYYLVRIDAQGVKNYELEIGTVTDKTSTETIKNTFTVIGKRIVLAGLSYSSTYDIYVYISEPGKKAIAIHTPAKTTSGNTNYLLSSDKAPKITNFKVQYQAVYPKTPAGLTATADASAALKVTLSWTNPTESNLTGVAPVISKAVISRKLASEADSKYAEIKTVTEGLTAGEAASYVDDAVPAAGIYTYKVVLEGPDGVQGVTSTATVETGWVGPAKTLDLDTDRDGWNKDDWTIFNGNYDTMGTGDPRTWELNSSSAYITSTVSGTDDWLFSSYYNFEAGKNYYFHIASYTANPGTKLQIKHGAAQKWSACGHKICDLTLNGEISKDKWQHDMFIVKAVAPGAEAQADGEPETIDGMPVYTVPAGAGVFAFHLEYSIGSQYTGGSATLKRIQATEYVQAETVTVSAPDDKAEVLLGSTLQLTATVAPDNAFDKTVTWSTSDAETATVDEQGVVTGVKVGTATITATCGAVSGTIEIAVKPIVAETVALDITEKEVLVGAEFKLTATVAPENVTDPTVTWSTSDATVATVDDEGNVKTLAVGTATITAACGDAKATCAVTVKPVPAETITLSQETIEAVEGQKVQLTATVGPDNTTDKTVTWASSDETIATVDETGMVTIVKPGECDITATCGAAKATCHVKAVSGIMGIIVDSLDSIEIYTLGGIRIADTTDLVPGFYIVRYVRDGVTVTEKKRF